MAQINRIGPDPYQKDPMDTIAQALGIAHTVYGIYDNKQKRDIMQQDLATKTKQQEIEAQRYKAQESRDLEKLNLDKKRLNLEEQKQGQEYSLKSRTLDQGKQLPAGDAATLGNANAAFKSLEDVKELYKSNKNISGPLQGFVSKAKGALEIGKEGTQFKSYDAQLKTAAQTIGKYLEGGKLTDADIARYRDILPNNYDSPEAAENKATLLQNLLAQKQQSELEAYKQAGYNVGNIQSSPLQSKPNIGPAPRTEIAVSEQDYLAAVQEKAKRDSIRSSGIASGIKGK